MSIQSRTRRASAYVRLCKCVAALFAVVLTSSVLQATSAADPGSLTDPATITALAAQAYVWGLGPQFIEESSLGESMNQLKYSSEPAAWNNDYTNAGDASVLYVTGFVDFDKTSALVLTVPPSSPQYYVVAYYDAYANTIASVGTRTTPSNSVTSYLLVGPKSPYANKYRAKIHDHEYPVIASDTNVNLFLIRVGSNTLIDAPAPTSVPNVVSGMVQKFALNSLQDFEANGYQPVYPSTNPEPTAASALSENLPQSASDFFTQLGNALASNPIPNRGTALSGTSLADLPSWIVPQYGATTQYLVPSYMQKETLDSFKPIGLTEKGFQMPSGWGTVQQTALQAGYLLGKKTLDDFIDKATAGADTNYWGILNNVVGTYPNTTEGYLSRSLIVVEGGVANIPLDAVYPTNVGPFDGNSTYTVTFSPSTSEVLPAVGIYPPMVGDAAGIKGFWSLSVYATESDQSDAPFIAQSSVSNTSYSSTDSGVASVDAATNMMTVTPPKWGTLALSTPILFGGDATAYGLQPGKVYYVATEPTQNHDNTYTFAISEQWQQELSNGPDGFVPVQGTGGQPRLIVDLLAPSGASALTYGVVKPIAQLGSSQLAANQLVKDADGSLTIWVGPELPDGAPASNWIPTPSTTFYSAVYPNVSISTAFQLTLRMYYPTPGNEPPSILPCAQTCAESYIPPVVQLVN